MPSEYKDFELVEFELELMLLDGSFVQFCSASLGLVVVVEMSMTSRGQLNHGMVIDLTHQRLLIECHYCTLDVTQITAAI